MKIVLQRVKSASVEVESKTVGKINQGLLLLVGVGHSDTEATILKVVDKIIQLRVFSDDKGKMNLSIKDILGEALVVSQFTLFAKTEKGNRPSFTEAAPPSVAIPLYEYFIQELRKHIVVECGIFGADMCVRLENDGPVTFQMEF
ncbi:MAG: D-aminoacyl-tRNA deacylase [Bacteroidota bacterium]|jgi:D-aminoacyl-tRNA deacylase